MATERRVRRFWDSQPCGSRHLDLEPGTKQYFIEFDRYFQDLYPHFLRFLDLESLRGKRVLEIGLGSGFELGQIARVASTTVALDISLATIRLNDARRRQSGLAIELIHGSATNIPLADHSIDTVVSIGCIHHIPEIERAVQEIRRVLVPGGVCKIMVYYRYSWRNLVTIPLARRFSAKWRGKSWQMCINEMYDGAGNPYGMVYSKEEVRRLFQGFEILSFEVRNFQASDLLAHWGGWVPRSLLLQTLGRVAGLDLYFTARSQQ